MERLGLAPYHNSDVLVRHFELTQMLWDSPLSVQEEIAEALVSMSLEARTEFKRLYPDENLPRHRGFYRLAVNYEKRKEYDKAITVCLNAREQEWSGDWDKRVERIRLKQARLIDQ